MGAPPERAHSRLATSPLAFPPRTCLPPGTACFLGGIGLVLLGWPVIGMGVEGFGFLNLFGAQSPQRLLFDRTQLTLTLALTSPSPSPYPKPAATSSRLPGFLRNLPLVGTLLNLPIIRSARARPLTRPTHPPAHPPAHPPRARSRPRRAAPRTGD